MILCHLCISTCTLIGSNQLFAGKKRRVPLMTKKALLAIVEPAWAKQCETGVLTRGTGQNRVKKAAGSNPPCTDIELDSTENFC